MPSSAASRRARMSHASPMNALVLPVKSVVLKSKSISPIATCASCIPALPTNGHEIQDRLRLIPPEKLPDVPVMVGAPIGYQAGSNVTVPPATDQRMRIAFHEVGETPVPKVVAT